MYAILVKVSVLFYLLLQVFYSQAMSNNIKIESAPLPTEIQCKILYYLVDLEQESPKKAIKNCYYFASANKDINKTVKEEMNSDRFTSYAINSFSHNFPSFGNNYVIAAHLGTVASVQYLKQNYNKFKDLILFKGFPDSIRFDNNIHSIHAEQLIDNLKSLIPFISTIRLPVFNLLLAAGADINERTLQLTLDGGRQTLLMLALENKRFDLADSILAHPDANKKYINAIDRGQNTALIEAVKANSSATVEKLIQKGAEVNCTSLDGNTPLWHAVASYHKFISYYNQETQMPKIRDYFNEFEKVISVLVKAGATYQYQVNENINGQMLITELNNIQKKFHRKPLFIDKSQSKCIVS